MSLIHTFRPPVRAAFPWRAVLCLLALSTGAWAGEPVAVTTSGQLVRWDTSEAIPYKVDKGPLGSRNHATAVKMVEQGFQPWMDTPTANVSIEFAGELSQDVTGRNFLSFLNGLRVGDPGPVLFDTDGSIFDTIAGRGASQVILGVTLPYPDVRTGRMLSALTILNGALHDLFSDAYLVDTAVHELGHYLGLHHSEINAEAQYDGDPTNDALSPVMSYFRGPNVGRGLHYDDQAWISLLYPSADFTNSTGTIHGRVLLPDGKTGLAGINVIARRVGDPKVTAVSCISGYLFDNGKDGSHDLARMGEYLIPGLPPGAYTIELQALDGTIAHRLPDAYLIGGPKFWHEASSPQDPRDAVTQVMVSAGQDIKGIDIVVNGEDLGEPSKVAEKEPNELPNGQSVTMPAVISGEIEDAGGDSPTAGPPLDNSDLPNELQDVYRVTIREPTTVTAILTAAQRGADLDLYLVAVGSNGPVTLTGSIETGTPPEVLQVRLPAGRYYFGVHRAGDRGTAYTLTMLSTPAPEPDSQPDYPWISHAWIGDVTAKDATAHWRTLLPTPSDLWYNIPYQEIGSTTKTMDHAMPLAGLSATRASDAQLYAYTEGGTDQVLAPVRPATPPADDGAPRIVLGNSVFQYFADLAEVQVRLTNAGDGDASNVKITQITPATGWRPLLTYFTGEALPSSIDVGGIGAGGAGVFVLRIIQASGSAAPKLTIHGTYTDASGATLKF